MLLCPCFPIIIKYLNKPVVPYLCLALTIPSSHIPIVFVMFYKLAKPGFKLMKLRTKQQFALYPADFPPVWRQVRVRCEMFVNANIPL